VRGLHRDRASLCCPRKGGCWRRKPRSAAGEKTARSRIRRLRYSSRRGRGLDYFKLPAVASRAASGASCVLAACLNVCKPHSQSRGKVASISKGRQKRETRKARRHAHRRAQGEKPNAARRVSRPTIRTIPPRRRSRPGARSARNQAAPSASCALTPAAPRPYAPQSARAATKSEKANSTEDRSE